MKKSRQLNNNSNISTVQYRIRYHNGQWQLWIDRGVRLKHLPSFTFFLLHASFLTLQSPCCGTVLFDSPYRYCQIQILCFNLFCFSLFYTYKLKKKNTDFCISSYNINTSHTYKDNSNIYMFCKHPLNWSVKKFLKRLTVSWSSRMNSCYNLTVHEDLHNLKQYI